MIGGGGHHNHGTSSHAAFLLDLPRSSGLGFPQTGQGNLAAHCPMYPGGENLYFFFFRYFATSEIYPFVG